jgi:hypothetical protein
MRARGPEPNARVIVLAPPAPEIVVCQPAHHQALEAVRGYLDWFWSFTECQVCGEFGRCMHREPDVDIARAEDWFSYLEGLQR